MSSNMPIDETEPNDASQQGMVKCPQCGKMVSKAFPYCEFCTFPIGEMLRRGSDPDFVANELKEEKRQQSQGRRSAIDSLRMSRGTAVRIVGVAATISIIGVGGYVLNGMMKARSAKQNEGGNKERVIKTPTLKTIHENPAPRPVVHDNPIYTPSPIENTPKTEQPTQQTWTPKPTPPAQRWTHSKDWYEEQSRDIQRNMIAFCSGGYLFDRSDAAEIARQIKALQKAISEDDARGCDTSYDELSRQFKMFSESCRWQQGLKHAKIPHIVSSYRRGVWDAEDGYEFVNPGTSDLTVREKVQQLSHPVDWYIRECDVISQNVRNVQNGPYYYDSQLANQILSNASQLRWKINTEKPKIVDSLCLQLQQSYREFKSSCRWRSGVRHPSIAHVFSSDRENTWNAENGWEFVHPGTSDLSVRKKVVAQRCNKCRGSGRITVKYRCGRCGGNGRIKNPAAEVGQAVKDVVNIFGGRNARRISNVPTGPAYITCPDCGGRRFSTQETNCDSCGGTGHKYR